VKIGIIGATGFTGFELVNILAKHPVFEIAALTSTSQAGVPYSSIYGRLRDIADMQIMGDDYDKCASMTDAVFLCLPHTASQEAAAFFLSKGKKVVDLSADFRLGSRELYESVYKVPHTKPELFEQAVYGIPEIFGEQLKTTKLCATPGCYPTSVIMPLYPLIIEELIDTGFIIADSKSGVSGAGKTPSEKTHFCSVYDNFQAYGVLSHRHNPEMNYILSKTGTQVDIVFTPHLAPINKGIESTIYAKTSATAEKITDCLKTFYKGRKFVRILDIGTPAATANVRDTNFIDISVFKKGDKLVITSAVDNLVKGASGAAVQCMNVMAGIDEASGLV
jgi:N-acetyl-gamma-glutamyl-phosphate reductase